jgi:hypothetical protein
MDPMLLQGRRDAELSGSRVQDPVLALALRPPGGILGHAGPGGARPIELRGSEVVEVDRGDLVGGLARVVALRVGALDLAGRGRTVRLRKIVERSWYTLRLLLRNMRSLDLRTFRLLGRSIKLIRNTKRENTLVYVNR